MSDKMNLNGNASVFEIWNLDGGAIEAGKAEYFERLRADGKLPDGARLLHRYQAATHEECMAIRNLRMGWGRYEPEGDSEECPLGCGAFYYPKGSGECPNCGQVRILTRMRDLPGFDVVMDRYMADASGEFSIELRKRFGDMELMLLAEEQTTEKIEQVFLKLVAGLRPEESA
jgi:hypothetical protein